MSIQSILNNPLHIITCTIKWLNPIKKFNARTIASLGWYSHKFYMGTAGPIKDKRCVCTITNLYFAYGLCKCI